MDLIRKRAEHNEGCVTTLEEITLHQEDLEKITLLGQVCRHLKILYLQSNLILKIENLHRMKELEYLNLAVNNVQKIENLQRCESLKKLDLTVNFIPKAGLLSVESLQHNEFMDDLYLMGNPCTDWEGYRDYVIAVVPTLKRLDGKEVTPTERIIAKQNYPALRQRLEDELEAEGVDLEKAKRIEDAYNAPLDEDCVETDPNKTSAWSIETRVKDHREMRAEKLRNDEKKKSNMDKLCNQGERVKTRRTGFDPLPTDPNARIYQKNEGEWTFKLAESEDERNMVLDVDIGKFIDISLVDVDIQPHWVRMLCKGRLLQLELFEEVNPDQSNAQRSHTTGHLVITMPKVKEFHTTAKPKQDFKAPPVQKVSVGNKGSVLTPPYKAPGLNSISGTSVANIMGGRKEIGRCDMKAVQTNKIGNDDSDSDDEVPPLMANC
eukprot:CAMPEP_0198204380 /NCGR_PEP_ID=MMETSP1445-20131203/7783_1 /TAXON_ID=36898 /ORGANISM="Pyramimonas sp., Strain CCMP2087" /LENGTH=434 /DNA_ID=CAMNT_0043876237 /DNA_START=163 /DNA_END=1467 /DNA_ORIENTATION=-